MQINREWQRGGAYAVTILCHAWTWAEISAVRRPREHLVYDMPHVAIFVRDQGRMQGGGGGTEVMTHLPQSGK